MLEGSTSNPVPVGADAPVLEVLASMQAMRRLKPDPVPDNLVRQLIEAASWAGTASHLQRQSFVVVTDRGQMARLAPIWQAAHRLYIATFSERPPDADKGAYARTLAAVAYQAEHFAETPVLIVACYDNGGYPGRVQRRMLRAVGDIRRFGARRTANLMATQTTFRIRSEAASIYPAVQNLLIAARSLGLAANLTTWHLMAEGEVKRILGIPKHVQTYALIPIGWPLGEFGRVRRRPVDGMIHRDRW